MFKETMFENFDICRDNSYKDETYFIVGVKDRGEHEYDEKWVFATLSEKEAEHLFNDLKEHLKK